VMVGLVVSLRRWFRWVAMAVLLEGLFLS
jgi:hypothetical protein